MKKNKSGFNWTEKILILLWGGIELSFSVLADLGDLFAYHSQSWGWNAKEELCTTRSLERIIRALKKEELIEETQIGEKHQLKLTHKGELALNWFTPRFEKPRGKWSGYWYLVVFDIPEKIKRARNLLRRKLHHLGFGQLQKSVFISAYNSLLIIDNLAKQNEVNQYIRTMVVKKIDNQKELIKQAWPWPIMEEQFRKFLKKAGTYSKIDKKQNPFKIKELERELVRVLEEDPRLPSGLTPISYLALKNKAINFIKNLSQ